jgi:tetratricopeptide (TPR) repeat protein
MNKKTLGRLLDTALAHHKSGRHAEAESLYAQIHTAAPRLFDGWYLAGTLEVNRDRPEAAIPLLQRALRLSPGSTQCKLFLGMALADTGRFAEAEKPLRAGLGAHPGYSEAWENLAAVLCALERSTEATECLRRVLALQPDRTDIQERLATLGVGWVSVVRS